MGRVHYVNGKFISSDLCFVLKPIDSDKLPVNLEFYYSIFKSLKQDLVKSTATGTAKKSINKTNFGNYKIPYYNIEKQNRLKPILKKLLTTRKSIMMQQSKAINFKQTSHFKGSHTRKTNPRLERPKSKYRTCNQIIRTHKS